MVCVHHLTVILNNVSELHNTYHTKMPVWTCTKTIKSTYKQTHTHSQSLRTDTFLRQERKYEWNESEQRRAPWKYGGVSDVWTKIKCSFLLLHAEEHSGCLDFPLCPPFPYIPVKTQQGQKVGSWPRAESSPAGVNWHTGRNCKNTL